MTTDSNVIILQTSERDFAIGTTVTTVTDLADNAVEASAAVLADQTRHLRTVAVTLPGGMVLETVHGVDFSFRLAGDRRDRSVTE
jgi:hypothetical protein